MLRNHEIAAAVETNYHVSYLLHPAAWFSRACEMAGLGIALERHPTFYQPFLSGWKNRTISTNIAAGLPASKFFFRRVGRRIEDHDLGLALASYPELKFWHKKDKNMADKLFQPLPWDQIDEQEPPVYVSREKTTDWYSSRGKTKTELLCSILSCSITKEQKENGPRSLLV